MLRLVSQSCTKTMREQHLCLFARLDLKSLGRDGLLVKTTNSGWRLQGQRRRSDKHEEILEVLLAAPVICSQVFLPMRSENFDK